MSAIATATASAEALAAKLASLATALGLATHDVLLGADAGAAEGLGPAYRQQSHAVFEDERSLRISAAALNQKGSPHFAAGNVRAWCRR